jgi:hypothetical protein
MMAVRKRIEHEKNRVYNSIKGLVESVSAVSTGVAIRMITI